MKRPIQVGEIDLATAREQMIERLMDGKDVDGMTFADILDCHFDSTPRAAAADVARHLLNMVSLDGDDYSKVERHRNLERWMRALVEHWVDSKPDLIRSLAVELVTADEAA